LEILIDRVIVTGEEVEIRYVILTDSSSERACTFFSIAFRLSPPPICEAKPPSPVAA
jgi:hypothetical protein